MANKKNILLLGSELGKGGAERSISLLSYYLEQAGHNVTLCLLSGTDRTRFYKTCEEVIFVDPPKVTGVVAKINAWRYRIKRIKEIKRSKNIDICISFLEGPDYVNVLTKGSEKIVLSIRGSKMFDKEIKGRMGEVRKRILIPYLYKRADSIVCVTQALADELHQYFNISYNKLKVIYNFYETEEIRAKAKEALTTDEAKIFSKKAIITSGRLHVAKEHDKMIRLLKHVKQHEDARLVILGDGELLNSLVELTHSLGMKSCVWNGQYEDADVYFMGFQKNAFKFYEHSKIFALSSSWEGFPNVLAEALVCRKVVVSTDCPTGPREILDVAKLGPNPIKMSIRKNVGSLLPMLNEITEEVTDIWTKDINYWLDTPQPSAADFDELTDRFTLDTLMKKWEEIIQL